jgi:RNA recognition motif-containing protein
MEAAVSSAKLYVGNLSYSTSEATIRTTFEAHGTVASVNLITDRDTGRPKGFGFVEMGSPEEAQKAKDALDGTQLDGRALKVDVAKEQAPRAPRPGGGYGGGGYGGGGSRGGYGGGSGGGRGGYGGGGGSRW